MFIIAEDFYYFKTQYIILTVFSQDKLTDISQLRC